MCGRFSLFAAGDEVAKRFCKDWHFRRQYPFVLVLRIQPGGHDVFTHTFVENRLCPRMKSE